MDVNNKNAQEIMDTIDWNQMSDLHLIYRINHEILHPLGLAMSRNPSTGTSDVIYIAPDGIFEYADSIDKTVLTKEEIQEKINQFMEDKKRN